MPATKLNNRQAPLLVVRTITAATHNETEVSGTIVLFCDTTSNSITVNLPTAVGNNAVYMIKKTVDANQVTIDPSGAQTIDGGSTAVLNRKDEAVTVIPDNTNMMIF